MENTSFKVFIEDKNQAYGKIYLEPLERGYGDTLGNALRRLLLSSIRGAAVTAVRIDGVLHEFSTIKGVREDVIEILMNLKHIPIKAKSGKVSLNADGFKIITLDSDELSKDFFTRAVNPGVITAKDMPWDNDFEFCGDGILCTLEPGSHLVMEIYVEQGVGYLSAERERPSQPPLPVDALLTDAIFSPVKRVNYEIEPARVGQSIDFERLVLEVWTNGAVSPEEAVSEASRIAESYFGQIAETVGSAPHITRPIRQEPTKPVPQPPKEPPAKPVIDDGKQLNRSIHELELSIRSENCLLRGGINNIGDLMKKSRDDLLKIRNLGKISLSEIETRLETLGLVLQPSAAPQPAESAEVSKTEKEKEKKPENFTSDAKPEDLVKEIKGEAETALDNVPDDKPSDLNSKSEAEAESDSNSKTAENDKKPGKTPGTKGTKGKKDTKTPKKPKTKKAAKTKEAELEAKAEVKSEAEAEAKSETETATADVKEPEAELKANEANENVNVNVDVKEEKTEQAETNAETAPENTEKSPEAKPKKTRKKKETTEENLEN